MDDVFVYEFLFRGGETSKPDDDTWHVILARPTKDILGNVKLEITGALTPEKAAELGFTLDRIVSSLNVRAVETAATIGARAEEHELALEEQRTKLTAEHENVVKRNVEECDAIIQRNVEECKRVVADVEDQCVALIRQRDAQAADLRAEVAQLRAQLADAQTKKAE